METIIPQLTSFLKLMMISMVPFVLAAQGTMLGGRTGVFNVAQEGVMLVGASVGFLIGYQTGSLFAGMVAAMLIGGLGAFMTSSNLSSNILFGALQQSSARALELAEPVALAGQTAGAAVANSVAPGNVLLGVGAVGLSGGTGDVIRRTIVYVLAVVVVLGLVGLAAQFIL